MKSDFFPADWYANQDFDIYGGAVKDRILITGPVVNDEKGVVKQDTYLMTITPKAENAEAQTAAANDAYDVSIEPTDKVFSQSKVFYENAVPYDNHFYVIGSTDNESRNVIFAHGAVETIPSPGDSSIPIVKMRVHGRNYGWSQGWMEDTQTLGTTGQALRLEAVETMIQTDGSQTPGLYIDYRVHMKNFGWGCYVHDGATAGTTGQSRRIEAIQMRLFGEKADKYDIYYRVHMKDIGWGKWAKNDEVAGTTGQARRFEAIEVQLIPKGCATPDDEEQ